MPKHHPDHLKTAQLTLLGCLLSCALVTSSHGGQPSPAKPAQPEDGKPKLEMVFVKSSFSTDFTLVKDPFFPGSTRITVKPELTNGTPVVKPRVIDGLLLKGISGTKQRRLALINTRTFEVGEEQVMRINGETATIRCLEITDNSVFITIDGFSDKSELKLLRSH